MHIKLVGCNGRFTHSTLSLFYVRQCFARHLSDISITLHQQAINDSYYEALLSLTDDDPVIVCFSVYIWNHERIKRFITDLAKLCPQTQIIIGGPEACKLQTTHPKLCTIEGEVEGLQLDFYKDLKSGCLQHHYVSPDKTNFHTPYKGSDFTNHLANRHIYYESSRGCPYQCSYCLSAKDTNLRHLPVSQVVEELELILAHNPKIIRFIDRTFNAIPDRTVELWQHIINLDTSCHFHFEISPDVFTDEMFAVLQNVTVNRFQFEIGLQSTNPETLHAVKRKTNTTRALAHIKRLVGLDTIHLHIDLILGLPQETYASYQKSFNDVFKLGCHYIQMGLLKILPNTPMSENNPELTASSYPPYELLKTPYLSPDELKELYWFGECVEKFHNTHFFKPLFTYIRQKNENGFNFFLQLLNVCKKEQFFTKASTQKLLSEMLAIVGQTRKDKDQYIEILQLCWLYSGMRKLPSHLPSLGMQKLKAKIYQNSPQNHPEYYTYKTRNLFFRQAEFALFSSNTIQTILPDIKVTQILCFLPPPQNRSTIFKQAQVILFKA